MQPLNNAQEIACNGDIVTRIPYFSAAQILRPQTKLLMQAESSMNPKAILKNLLLVLALLATLSGGSSVGFAADAVPSATRETAAKAENGYYYTVQKGDTLWDLSQRFSVTPWVWPELWEENSETIANPHLIYPGQKIRLTRRLGRPTVTAAKGIVEPSVAGIHYYFSLSDQYGFIRKVPVTPEAFILKPQESGKTLIGEGDIVYVRPEGNAAISQGQLLTIFRTFKPLFDPQSKELIGTQHLLCGILEIVKREPQYAIAKVVESYRAIEVGDQLMPYQRRSPRIELRDSQPGIDAKLITTEDRLNIFGESHVAFINQGNRHGIKPGQIYSIYRTDDYNFGTVSSPRPVSIPVDFGELLVLHAEEHTATVLITDSKKESHEGTRVRTPMAMR
jgi:LysM repeat protein